MQQEEPKGLQRRRYLDRSTWIKILAVIFVQLLTAISAGTSAYIAMRVNYAVMEKNDAEQDKSLARVDTAISAMQTLIQQQVALAGAIGEVASSNREDNKRQDQEMRDLRHEMSDLRAMERRR